MSGSISKRAKELQDEIEETEMVIDRYVQELIDLRINYQVKRNARIAKLSTVREKRNHLKAELAKITSSDH